MMTYDGHSIDAHRDELKGWIDMTYTPATLCETCGTIPGLHIDGRCPITRQTRNVEQAEDRKRS